LCVSDVPGVWPARELQNARYHSLVIRRFYVHNFRCLENFELPLAGQSSILLIGKNGSGKTTVGLALEVLQQIARGTNQVSDLVSPQDFAGGRLDAPMRFEIEILLGGKTYAYSVAFEMLPRANYLAVSEERLTVDGQPRFTRSKAPAGSNGGMRESSTGLVIDWIGLQLVALPLVQELSEQDSLFIFKQALRRMLILRPLPYLIKGESEMDTLEPSADLKDFGAWFAGLLALAPSAYRRIDEYVKQVMPDVKDIKNPVVGPHFRRLEIQFSTEQGRLSLPLAVLSDGEKCFLICGLVLAANEAYGPLICFWDEPDNYLAINEVGDFLMELRRAFQSGGQFIATSHNSEAIRQFSDENTLLLYRKSHLEPTLVRRLSELEVIGDKVRALIRGDVEP
jgi:energy-coupling factor transporter ATP-binding protein EcfA2